MGKAYQNVIDELFSAIKFCLESKKGKYSLQTYLDIVGEYADRQIILNEKNGLNYKGGNCRIKQKEENMKLFIFRIELFFENEQGEAILKEAEREVPLNQFVSEAIEQLKSGELFFNISRPGGKK